MIYVSRYSNPELKTGKYTAVRISVGTPKYSLGYTLSGEIKDLMPFGLLGIGDKDVYEEKYVARLNRVGVDRLRKQLREFEKLGKPVVLLCYEDIRKAGQWCHRTTFAHWWQEQTGEIVTELRENMSGSKKPSRNASDRIQERERIMKQVSIFELLV